MVEALTVMLVVSAAGCVYLGCWVADLKKECHTLKDRVVRGQYEYDMLSDGERKYRRHYEEALKTIENVAKEVNKY